MSDDPLEAGKKAAISSAAAGVTAAAVTVVTGNPFAAAAAGASVTGGMAWLRSLAEGKNQALMDARVAELENAFRVLDERVARIEQAAAAERKSEERSATARTEVYSAFALAVAAAQTDTRRESLINAAAHQFDPRQGDQASRKYWFDQIARLDDIDLRVLRLLGEHGQFGFSKGAFLTPKSKFALPHAEQVAVVTHAARMAQTPWPLIQGGKTFQAPGGVGAVGGYELTETGRVIVEFISPPAPLSTSEATHS